jgi:hypothetical protein
MMPDFLERPQVRKCRDWMTPQPQGLPTHIVDLDNN